MKNNFWRDKLLTNYPALKNDIAVDCAVIGGGLAGIMCAAELLERGQKVCVLEAKKVAAADTASSSGMISFAHDLIYYRLIKKHGEIKAKEYLELNKAGAEKIKSLIEKYQINCDYQTCDMFLYAQTLKGLCALNKERQAYKQLGYFFDIVKAAELPFVIKGALRVPNQGCLNPYLFTAELAKAIEQKGVKIYENTRVTQPPEKGMLRVGEFSIKAKNFVVCTHFPYINLPGFYFLKLFQSRSSNVIFKSRYEIRHNYESAEEKGFEYRNAGGKNALCGGASARCGKYKNTSRYQIVKNNIIERFGAAEEDILSQFAAQDCMTMDMLPLAGRYGATTENVFVVTGFNKWGFSNSAACAEIIADLTEGKEINNVFDTKRLYALKAPIKQVKNIAVIAAGFTDLLFSPDDKKLSCIQNGQGAIVRHKGHRLGVYRDSAGQLKIINALCPHMGCGLKWNKDDLSWDCPCHGSRFDTDGNIINGPSVKDAQRIQSLNL